MEAKMTDTTVNPAGGDTALSVRGVYQYFMMLQQGNLLEPFLKECDERNLKLIAGPDLFETGARHFRGLVRIAVAGPADCPACPKPPLNR
jgi:hypothetical protein